MVLLFRNPVGTGNRSDAIRKLTDWARSILKADADVGVSVIELDCCADGCCEPETLILVMHGDRSIEAITISKSLETITYADLADSDLIRPGVPT
jgi:exoribonuclease II